MVPGRDTITIIMERMSSVLLLLLRIFGNNKKANTIIENIKGHLLTIKGVAEHRDVIATPDWLTEVSDVITKLQDLLEDPNHLPPAALPKQSTITSFLSTRCTLFRQLKQIEKRLQLVAADSTKLSLRNSASSTRGAPVIVVRAADIESTVRKILDPTTTGAVHVAAIAGIQGMGKTMLARSVCDDVRVKSSFDLVIWIDGLHHEFYLKTVVERMIYESAAAEKNKKLKYNLREALNGRRFLLVLDDLQSENRDEWLRLQQILTEAASPSGGAVLVTTQNYLAAIVVDSKPLNLSGLTEKGSWALFEHVVGRDNPSESKIKDAQIKKMVNKCGGVPLAILTLARIVGSGEAEDIDHLEEKFMQEMQLIYYNELPSWHLRQCFAYLSFLFNSRFSIKPEMLIRLWMAEGFLGPLMNSHSSSSSSSSSSSLPQPQLEEDLGLECIQEFRRRSILMVEEEQEVENRIVKACTMEYSKLLMELSAFVAGKDRFNFCMDDAGENVKETVRRVSMTFGFDVSDEISKSLTKKNKSLHTILFPLPSMRGSSLRIPNEVTLGHSACDAILCAFKSLRVLILADLGMKILPISIGELKSLRYLDLSLNNMKKLPNTIGKLKNLQTLILSHCHQLRELPYEMKHLVSLRHLELEECLHLTHMPSAIWKKLANLQTLSCFVVSSSHNRKHMGGFGELMNLNNLRGKLQISHLERLKFDESEQEDGHDDYLKEKQHLVRLTLKWNHDGYDEDNDNHDDETLKHLKPHQNLQGLSIVGYRGKTYSGWSSLSLENLVEFTLYNCPTCESLPPLDQLPKLKTLRIRRLDSLKYITTDDQDDGRNELGLGLLKKLSILDCPELTSWWKKGRTHSHSNNAPPIFASLEALEVSYCPKLDSMPLYPNLESSLKLTGSSVKPLLETISHTSTASSNNRRNIVAAASTSNSSQSQEPLSKLKRLAIENVVEEVQSQSPPSEDWLKNFTSLRYLWISESRSMMKGFKHLTSLKYMAISNCTEPDLRADDWEGLQGLKHLTLEGVTGLKYLPEGIKHLTSLDYLSISRCPQLTGLTEKEEVIGHLKSLTSLSIEDCHMLASLPKGLSQLRSLYFLTITNCPLLLPRCQKDTGDDWPQIEHVKHIDLIDASQLYEESYQ